ncbi:carbohydrate kinase [Microbacterium sp. C5A9]|nr:carbohydrate kinase [Microbacterium sp. C5A9]
MLVVGEALVDVVDEVAHPGGSPLNVAVGLARLGLETTLLTSIGDDEHGRMLAQHVVREGVRLARGSVCAGEHTSRAVATLDADGVATYDFDLRWTLPDAVPATLGEDLDVDLVHVGSLGAVLEPGARAVAAILAAAPDTALRAYDPNVRAQLMGPRDEALVRVEEIMRAAHVVKLSDADAEYLYPGMEVEAVLRHIADLGPRLAVVTRGAAGCAAVLSADSEVFVGQALPVDVVDTIGAGDAFMSGLLFGLVSTGAAATLVAAGRAIGADDRARIETAIDLALSSAAVAVSRAGAAPPYPADLGRAR